MIRIKDSYKKFISLPRKHLLITSALILVLAAVATLLYESKTQPSSSKVSVSLTDTCSQKGTQTYACYKAKLQSIVTQGGPQPAFTFLKSTSEVPLVKADCHQLAHIIGRAAYAKYGNLSDTFAQGDQFCWSGYYHGIMEQVTTEKGVDYVQKNAQAICQPLAKKQKYGFYHYNCVHGLGHGFMEALEGDLFTSLKDCDALSDSWEQSSCWGGVFMQNIMNEQTPDASGKQDQIFLKSNEPMYPCTAVEEKYKGQCYLMQTSYVLEVMNYDFAKVFTACSLIESDYQPTCYESLGRDASGQSVYNSTEARRKCLLGFTQTQVEHCVIGAAKDYVANFHGTSEAYAFCSELPSDYTKICSTTVKNYYAIF